MASISRYQDGREVMWLDAIVIIGLLVRGAQRGSDVRTVSRTGSAQEAELEP